jgi:hypothetical protein
VLHSAALCVSFCRAPPLKLHTVVVKDTKQAGCVQSSIGYEGRLHISNSLFHRSSSDCVIAARGGKWSQGAVGTMGRKGPVLKQQ